MQKHISVKQHYYNGTVIAAGKYKARLRNVGKGIDKKYLITAVNLKEATRKAEDEYSRLLNLSDAVEDSEPLEELQEPLEPTGDRFRHLLQAYLNSLVLNGRATQTIEYLPVIFNKHFVPIIGNLDIAEIRYSQIEQVKSSLKEKIDGNEISTRTANMYLGYLRACFHYWEKKNENYRAPRIEFFKDDGKKREKQIITTKIYKSALKLCADDTFKEAFFRIGADMSLRLGEILGLRFSDIYLDDKNPHLFVKQQLLPDGKRYALPKGGVPRTKTAHYLNDELIALLKKIKKNNPEQEYVLMVNGKHPDRRKMGDLYESLTGGRITHSMRHYFITDAHANGVALKDISVMAGHADVKTTADYLDSPDENRIAAAKKRSKKG